MAISAIIFLTFFPHSASAEPPKSSEFLKYSEGERQWWYKGAFETLAHSMSQIDKAKADCISEWYFPHKEERHKEIEATMTKYPAHAASSIILSLVQRQCGKLSQ